VTIQRIWIYQMKPLTMFPIKPLIFKRPPKPRTLYNFAFGIKSIRLISGDEVLNIQVLLVIQGYFIYVV
jgi:hypothetical protein